MREIDMLIWGLGIIWGFAMGLLYFGGLWYTLVKLPDKARPRLWLAGSYVLRVGFTLLGFWLILQEGLVALFVSLGGFFFMRLILIRRLGMGQTGEEHAN